MDASSGKISNKADELKKRYSLGLDIDNVAPLPGAGEIDIQIINKALSEVQHPKRRIKQEFFWYHIKSERDEGAFSHILRGDFDKAESIWKEQEEGVSGGCFLQDIFPKSCKSFFHKIATPFS